MYNMNSHLPLIDNSIPYILVTGGLGYIGRHVCAQLLESNYNLVIISRMSAYKEQIFHTLKQINSQSLIQLVRCDLDDLSLKDVFCRYTITHVIHLANMKCISESQINPLKYYKNNIMLLINLLEIMKEYNCKNIIYSSSATVYGSQLYPVTETSPTGLNITNPYGMTKYFSEKILQDLYDSDCTWRVIILRYFNPISSHSKYNLGEEPNDSPNNLFSCILKTAQGISNQVNICGHQYDTLDGTGIRDFVHVEDVADAHQCVIQSITQSGCYIYNIGTGKGLSVMELIRTFEKINGIEIPFQLCESRKGDLPIIYAKVDKIKNELKWVAKKTIEDMCLDGFRSIKL